MLEKSYLYATIFVAFWVFLIRPFKEAEGKRKGFVADVGARPGGAGSPAVNWGETGDVGAVHPASPITSGQAAPTEGVCFPGVISWGMFDC